MFKSQKRRLLNPLTCHHIACEYDFPARKLERVQTSWLMWWDFKITFKWKD